MRAVDKGEHKCTFLWRGRNRLTEVTIYGNCDFWFHKDYWKWECDDGDVLMLTTASPVKTRYSAIRKDKNKNYGKAFQKMVYEKLENE